METQTGTTLSKETIRAMDADALIDSVILLFDLEPLLRAPLMAFVRLQATKLGIADIVTDLIAQYEAAEKKEDAKYARAISRGSSPVEIDRDGNGRAIASIPNFLKIVRNDPHFADIRYNELRRVPEIMREGRLCVWDDTDDGAGRGHIEGVYKIHSTPRYYDAMNQLFRERAYHPVRERIEAIAWDGQSRLETFLHRWMKCEDTPYTREASRLIFAGGIHRVYDPGCKFDDMVVLIGTKQGEGKTTLVRWLAMEDRFFREVTEIEGQKGMEALDGAWICEVGELLALTKAKEKEAVKSYLTRQVDTYRQAWGRRVGDYPRQCLFIGTTNRREFLTDMSGNRRFYPVVVSSSGYDLFSCQEEIKADIAQCWAEALHRMRAGELPPVADPNLIPDIRQMQDMAREDDYRVGLIEEYVRDKEQVCNIELWEEALGNKLQKPTNKDISEITSIMQVLDAWERVKERRYIPKYGQQRVWNRRVVEIGVEQKTIFLDMTGSEIGVFDGK